jgi:hypothetical protein
MNPDNPWNDDDSWWHQLDLEMQEMEEADRIARFERALAELEDVIHQELIKIHGGLN